MKRRLIPIEEAVGHVLAHDITEIRPKEFKGRAFKKGHVVSKEDIPHLKRLGKEHLFVLELDPDEVHEDEAAIRIAKAVSGPGVEFDPSPYEGKISLRAALLGLLKIRLDLLKMVCTNPEICLSTLHRNSVVQRGQVVAATRVIPLVVKDEVIKEVEEISKAYGRIIEVRPFNRPEVGIIITGNEIYHGLIQDRFEAVLREKLEGFNCPIKEVIFTPDSREVIANALNRLLDLGCRLLIVAGGMSVDPDDVSRLGIQDAGAKDMVYGTSILPGAMFLYAQIRGIPVIGLPACVIYFKTTVFDLMLPRILAGDAITRQDIAEMAHGGLCLNCKECRYPVCPFGKA